MAIVRSGREYFFDVYLNRWRGLKFYERYKKKIMEIEGVWIHDCFGNSTKIKSLLF